MPASPNSKTTDELGQHRPRIASLQMLAVGDVPAKNPHKNGQTTVGTLGVLRRLTVCLPRTSSAQVAGTGGGNPRNRTSRNHTRVNSGRFQLRSQWHMP